MLDFIISFLILFSYMVTCLYFVLLSLLLLNVLVFQINLITSISSTVGADLIPAWQVSCLPNQGWDSLMIPKEKQEEKEQQKQGQNHISSREGLTEKKVETKT